MAEPRAKVADNVDEQQAGDILRDLDSQARAAAQRANKRALGRKPLRAPCTVRYLAADGKTVLESRGRMREVSPAGASLLTGQAFAVDTGVHISVRPAAGEPSELTGTVVYARPIKIGWYLVGVRRHLLDDDRLSPHSRHEPCQRDDDEARAPQKHEQDQRESDAAADSRERALRLLDSAVRYGITSRETITKIVRLTLSSDHSVRRATIPALFQCHGHEAQQALVNLLNDPNSTIQGEAAEALGHMEAASAAEPLKELLSHDSVEVALRAAEALGRLKDRSGLPMAIRHLRRNHRYTRLAARVFGTIVGRRFRPNDAGVAQARRYLKTAKLK